MTLLIPPRTEFPSERWCESCGIHLALPPHRLLCPVCEAKVKEQQ